MKCAKCKEDKPDVLLRNIKDKTLIDEHGTWIDPPPLCVSCAATYPSHASLGRGVIE